MLRTNGKDMFATCRKAAGTAWLSLESFLSTGVAARLSLRPTSPARSARKTWRSLQLAPSSAALCWTKACRP